MHEITHSDSAANTCTASACFSVNNYLSLSPPLVSPQFPEEHWSYGGDFFPLAFGAFMGAWDRGSVIINIRRDWVGIFGGARAETMISKAK